MSSTRALRSTRRSASASRTRSWRSWCSPRRGGWGRDRGRHRRNAVVIGVVVDLLIRSEALSGVRDESLSIRVLVLVAGILVIGGASALYIGAGMGAGPRDSLMLVVARRAHLRAGVVRTLIESAVTVGGFALGGKVGVGTLAFALGIGPAIEASFWLLGRSPLACGHEPSRPRVRSARDEGTGLRRRTSDPARRADACHEQAPAACRRVADGLLPAPATAARGGAGGARRDRKAPRRPDDRPARRRASHEPGRDQLR